VNSEPEEPLDRIRSEIRADAEAVRQRTPLPERKPYTGGAGELPDGAAHVTIAALAQHAGPDFVDQAYRTILRRAPDADGFARQMAALGAGAGKIEVLGDLRYSEEGRRHAVDVAGLRSRYLFAKLGRLPIVGTIVRYVAAFASLPHLVRYQRATEASLAVRFGETTKGLREAEARDVELRALIDATRVDLASAVAELSERLAKNERSTAELHRHVAGLHAGVVELSQLALTMNHWTTEVRKAIGSIESAQAERRAANDETEAAIVRHARARDAQRAERLRAWADEAARRLPRGATIVDVCGGSDWLAELAARGFKASSIETNAALHRDARENGLDVTLGDPATLLARTADASLDGLTMPSPERIAASIELLREARRTVKAGGCLLIGAADAVTTDRLAGAGFDATTLELPAGRVLVATRT